jgi:putative cofactor-binding repeat protein
MAAPSITIVNDSDITVASWDCGTVQANSDSTILTILVWNNRGGSTALSDLKDVSITTLDIDGGSSSDVVAGKWVQANVPKVDGNNTTWTAIGGTTVKYLRADALAAADGNVIRGIANDGTFTNAKSNYCTCRLKAHVPLNATPGTKVWKTRINGYYV